MINKSSKAKERLGKMIQKARKQVGYTQEKLADSIRISRTHMGHIEQGRKSPSLEVLEKISRALKVSLSDLLK